MKHNYFGTILLCAFLVLLSACSIQPKSNKLFQATHISSHEEETFWFRGRPFYKMQNDEYCVFISPDTRYLNSRSKWLFDVEITNLSDHNLLVEPGHFSYCICDSTESGWKENEPIIAIDPETQLRALDYSEMKTEQSYANKQAVNTLFSLFFLVGEVAQTFSSNKDPEKQAAWEENQQSLELEAMKERQKYIDEMAKIHTEQLLWSETSFRKHTLAPGRTTGGIVHFQAKNNAQFIKVRFNAGKEEFYKIFKIQEIPTRTVTTKYPNHQDRRIQD